MKTQNQANHNRNFSDSRAGLSLLELTLAAGIISVTLLASAMVSLNFYKSSQKMETLLNESSHAAIAERALYWDISNAEISYQLLTTATTSDPKSFFDYSPELTCLPQDPSCLRTFSITAEKPDTYFYLFIDDRKVSPPLPYHPTMAYTIGEPTQLGGGAKLTYEGINQNDAVNQIAKKIDPTLKDIWTLNSKRLFLLNTPLYLQPLNFKGFPDSSKFPRQHCFLGQVTSKDLTGISDKSLTFVAPFSRITKAPLSGSWISSADLFFRTLPSAAGVSPTVFIRPVKLIRYEITRDTPNGKTAAGSLIRTVYDVSTNKFELERLVLAKNIQNLSFNRSVDSTAMKIAIQRLSVYNR
ncbi:MAG: hypothetical protein RJB38_2463 [Pseudomonadota bacterium]|jgi:hypothetical protein